MLNKYICALLFGIAVSETASASLVTIDFESDAVGSVANGFVSAGVPGVHFSDPEGIDLRIYSDMESDGNSLLLARDDASGLDILFDFPVYSLALGFGNDDPDWLDPPELALLTVFNNSVQVGQVSLPTNQDDLMNQTISFSGASFTQATFRYVDSNLNGIRLAEVIDNISFENTQALPEPASIALISIGLGLVSFTRKRNAK